LKSALLISPYFLPSNVAGVQRVRLMASHLHEFGWEPTVVTVNPYYYEGKNDDRSLALVPDSLRIERVKAWPTSISRLLGFGDVSLRGQWTLRRRASELIRSEKIDLVFATVLPGYTSLVGAWVKRKFGLPFVLDYQDPWVLNRQATQSLLTKAGLAYWLATKLEPAAVAAAEALTAVSDETLKSLRTRGLVRDGMPIEIIPIGADQNDHAVAAKQGHSLIKRSVGELVVAHIGTITERMLPAVKALFRAVRMAIDAEPNRRFVLHFIGSSAQANGKDEHGLLALAQDVGLIQNFHLEPRRVGYLDALRTMQDVDILLLIGSTDSHYTASKIFPCWLARKPILALFHARSTVNDIAHELGGVRVINYDTQSRPEDQSSQLIRALCDMSEHGIGAVAQRNELAFENYSARTVAHRYARLFDRVVSLNGFTAS
jgi:hypothetical protein